MLVYQRGEAIQSWSLNIKSHSVGKVPNPMPDHRGFWFSRRSPTLNLVSAYIGALKWWDDHKKYHKGSPFAIDNYFSREVETTNQIIYILNPCPGLTWSTKLRGCMKLRAFTQMRAMKEAIPTWFLGRSETYFVFDLFGVATLGVSRPKCLAVDFTHYFNHLQSVQVEIQQFLKPCILTLCSTIYYTITIVNICKYIISIQFYQIVQVREHCRFTPASSNTCAVNGRAVNEVAVASSSPVASVGVSSTIKSARLYIFSINSEWHVQRHFYRVLRCQFLITLLVN